jgi:transposase InsO family protein
MRLTALCCRFDFLLHDRDTKFCTSFRAILRSAGVHSIMLPPRSPNLNAFAERWVRSIKNECLSKLILFGEASLRRTMTEFLKHYYQSPGERESPAFPASTSPPPGTRAVVHCQRFGGLLKFNQRTA